MARLLFLFFIPLLSFKSYSGEWVHLANGSVNCKVTSEDLCWPQMEELHLDFVFPSYTVLHSPWGDKWSGSYFYRYYIRDMYSYSGDLPANCTDGNTPQYPATDCPVETEPHSCPAAGTYIRSTWGRQGLNGWSMCGNDNCVREIVSRSYSGGEICYYNSTTERTECSYDVFYTGQTCVSGDNPGVNPPDHIYPEDPVDSPDPGTEPVEPDVPVTGGDDPIYDPDSPDDGLPDDPVNPPNPDPQPDPDNPDLSTGENAIVGELSEANQRLENIDSTLVDLTNTTKLDNDTLLEYQSHLLGKLNDINTTLSNGVGGGGGTSQAVVDGLGDIACLLDETCEGGGSQSSVSENQCEAFNCDGDAVICYIARKEWEKKCEVDDFLKEGGSGDQFLDGINQFITDNPSENVEAGSVDISNVMNKYTQGNGFEVTAGCPAPRSVDAVIANFTLDYQPFCDLALIINWFLISISLVGAALMIAKYGL